jgi:hypothetical protein
MSTLADRIDAHILEVYELVGELYPEETDDETTEVETIVHVIGEALKKYEGKITLLVTSSLYTRALDEGLKRQSEVA